MFVVLDCVTHLASCHAGEVAYCGSDGGIYNAHCAASAGIGAVIFNDAGIGRERAGVAGLALLEKLDVPAAAISHLSARIGDGKDGVARGVLTTVNGPAAKLGLKVGQSCHDALILLSAAKLGTAPLPVPLGGSRFEAKEMRSWFTKVMVMDAIALVKPEDKSQVVVAASHGGVIGNRSDLAIEHPVFACVMIDADRGIDNAGTRRLPALDEKGIAAACASAFSCRVGDGRSLWDDGFISTVNEMAQRHGGMIGQSTKQFVAAMVSARDTVIRGAQIRVDAAKDSMND